MVSWASTQTRRSWPAGLVTRPMKAVAPGENMAEPKRPDQLQLPGDDEDWAQHEEHHCAACPPPICRSSEASSPSRAATKGRVTSSYFFPAIIAADRAGSVS